MSRNKDFHAGHKIEVPGHPRPIYSYICRIWAYNSSLRARWRTLDPPSSEGGPASAAHAAIAAVASVPQRPLRAATIAGSPGASRAMYKW